MGSFFLFFSFLLSDKWGDFFFLFYLVINLKNPMEAVEELVQLMDLALVDFAQVCQQ